MLFDLKAQKWMELTQMKVKIPNMVTWREICVFQLPYRARVLPHAFQRPWKNQSPSHQRQLADWLLRILANDWYGL